MPVCRVCVGNGDLCAANRQTFYGGHFCPENQPGRCTPSALALNSDAFAQLPNVFATAQLTVPFCGSRSGSDPFGCKALVSFSPASFCRACRFAWPFLTECSGVPSSVNSMTHLMWTCSIFKERQRQKKQQENKPNLPNEIMLIILPHAQTGRWKVCIAIPGRPAGTCQSESRTGPALLGSRTRVCSELPQKRADEVRRQSRRLSRQWMHLALPGATLRSA